MSDPMTFWLMVTNLVLASVVLGCLGAVFFATLVHLARGIRRAGIIRELDRDQRRLLSDGDAEECLPGSA